MEQSIAIETESFWRRSRNHEGGLVVNRVFVALAYPRSEIGRASAGPRARDRSLKRPL